VVTKVRIDAQGLTKAEVVAALDEAASLLARQRDLPPRPNRNRHPHRRGRGTP
jgi:hypothetical protein